MATVTHIIRSYYDPADREELEHETGQCVDDQSDPWQTESSLSAQRRVRADPTFVPATISYDEWGVPSQTEPTVAFRSTDQPLTSTAEWYKSLTATSSSREVVPPRPSTAPTLSSSVQDSRPAPEPRQESITKNNWFISKALSSETLIKPSSPAPSLADLLARDRPPLPSEGRYIPPVWLHIGPSNRGFGMLQRSGWREGEGLGAHVIRQSITLARDIDVIQDTPLSVKVEEDTREVIDLTHSDSEASEDAPQDYDVMQGPVQTQAAEEASASHTQRSLLTPLPTILKADRLGIGLKAKTEGLYRRSRKRVTHNAAALAAHTKSAEEARRKRAAFGKGRRGFAEIHKREEDSRKATLAYLNE